MKSIISVFAAAIIILACAGRAHAFGISVGASAWYADWQMKEDRSGSGWNTMDRTLLYGPLLALRFTQDLSLSSAFLYGEFNNTNGDGETEVIERIDSDTALIYGINQYVKIFAGFKYMGYTVGSFTHASMGPGAGIGLVIPITGNLYVTGNISGMYLWGEDKGNNNPGNNDFTEYAFNSNAALTYAFSSAPVSLSLGGRYQYIESHYEETSDRNMEQRIFGVTISAIYSFEI